ncbi:MAG TPA: hypothetical protein VH280_04120 [Verrucomicrobiae bacterium]|jgi:hypothetical protein|nr:hypothetical protein [Verrucomicrobiae bacterium]
MSEQDQQLESRDLAFRRMVSLGTAVCVALSYGWLGGFVRQPDGDLIFHWRWLVLIWACIGFAGTLYFWRKVWPPENQTTTRSGVVMGVIAVAVPLIWWLMLPLRSQSGRHRWEVVTGLSAATLVLLFGAWMIYRLGKAFENDKAAE